MEPYTSQIVPRDAPAWRIFAGPRRSRDRYVKLLGRLGAWQGPEALDICSLIDHRLTKTWRRVKQTLRQVAARILEDVAGSVS